MLEEEYQPRRRLPRHLQPAPTLETPFAFEMREATPEDLPYVREIYNHYVRNTSITFDDKAMTLATLRRKFATMTKLRMPFIVAQNPHSGEILGYAYVYPWQERAGYRRTVEIFIYLGPAATGKGLGSALLGELIKRCRAAGIREVIAVIADKGAEASIRLHERYSFKRVGQMGKVGFKFDRWLGTVMMQKRLK